VENAPWESRQKNSTYLVEQLLQYVELEHPAPLRGCSRKVETVTSRDCLQALGGEASSKSFSSVSTTAGLELSPSGSATEAFLAGSSQAGSLAQDVTHSGQHSEASYPSKAEESADGRKLVRREAKRAKKEKKAMVRREPKAQKEASAHGSSVNHHVVQSVSETGTMENLSAVSKKVTGDHSEKSSTGVFKGMRKQPAFIVDVSVFSFDLDALEIRLHELSNVADLFALIESPVTHQNHVKPLVWARNKDKPRFRAFQDRVLHVVVNDLDVMKHLRAPSGNLTSSAKESVRKGTEKLGQMLQSLLSSPHLNGRELVVNFGHADEIPSARNMALMKQCEPQQLPIDSGVWVPMGRFDRAVRAETPVGGKGELPFTHGSPTFQDTKNIVERGLGESGRYLLGGWHLTAYAYPPHALLKLLTCASCTGKGIPQETVRMLEKGPLGVREFWEVLSTLTSQASWLQHHSRAASLEEMQERPPYRQHPDLLQPPHVVQCNPERFEVWYGLYDRRLNMAPADAAQSTTKMPRRGRIHPTN